MASSICDLLCRTVESQAEGRLRENCGSSVLLIMKNGVRAEQEGCSGLSSSFRLSILKPPKSLALGGNTLD